MDYSDATVKDAIAIINTRVDGSAVILTTTGMTPQEDERYEVILKNLRDFAGNIIIPSPRTLTVIQRDLPVTEATNG